MRLRHVLALVLIAFALATPSPASASLRTRAAEMKWTMFHLVNTSRRNHGLAPLEMNATLSKIAWHHSIKMADRRAIFHTTDLYDAVRRYRPHSWGENVGMAGTVRSLHRLFMQSAPHRANILGQAFRKVGVGVVRAGGSVWATLIFYG